MTEIERILSKGIIPESFLTEEIRDDFKVSTERKKIWAVELDLLLEIDKICEKHNIRYFLAGGNILGAVRHKGFIPWDDDIDVCMFRKDYELFCDICTNEIAEPYFLQTTMTEENCWFNNARLCNSNTTGIRKPAIGKKGINKGIFVDILPMDYVYDNALLRNILNTRVKIRTTIANAYSFNKNSSPFIRLISRTVRSRLLHFDVKKWYKKTMQIASKPSAEKNRKIGFVVWTPYKRERVTWDQTDYDSYVELPFEFFKIKVPIGYKDILSVMYGDYTVFPPIEKRGSWHQIIFDPNTPYEKYCEEHNV